jgi:transposase
LQAKGHTVVEVNRPNRQLRHQNGKSDPLDAESAARAVLSGQANARPKSADSSVEMIRHLKVARDAAVKAIAHVLIPGGVGIGQELAWLRKFDSGIAS